MKEELQLERKKGKNEKNKSLNDPFAGSTFPVINDVVEEASKVMGKEIGVDKSGWRRR